jgi:hypothetical protein
MLERYGDPRGGSTSKSLGVAGCSAAGGAARGGALWQIGVEIEGLRQRLEPAEKRLAGIRI